MQDECDFPENVNCELSIGEISKMKVLYGFVCLTNVSTIQSQLETHKF